MLPMLPCKGGGKGPELETFEKSLDEVSFDDAFIEIKSRNIEFVTKRVRLNLRTVAKLQTETAPEATKSHHACDMAIYTFAEGEVWSFDIWRKMGIKAGRDCGSVIADIPLCAIPNVDYDCGRIVVSNLKFNRFVCPRGSWGKSAASVTHEKISLFPLRSVPDR
jgi:hypothetical protein